MRKKLWILIIVFMSLNITACGNSKEEMWISGENTPENVDIIDTIVEEAAPEEITTIAVHICGEVNNPGVYYLTKGQRVQDAIFAAGGLTDNADETCVNQALLLEDSQQIIILAKGSLDNGNKESFDDGKININKASKGELTSINGIGDSRAEAIITYREENGPFKALEDIMQVSGIKEGLYEKIKNQIKIS